MSSQASDSLEFCSMDYWDYFVELECLQNSKGKGGIGRGCLHICQLILHIFAAGEGYRYRDYEGHKVAENAIDSIGWRS